MWYCIWYCMWYCMWYRVCHIFLCVCAVWVYHFFNGCAIFFVCVPSKKCFCEWVYLFLFFFVCVVTLSAHLLLPRPRASFPVAPVNIICCIVAHCVLCFWLTWLQACC